MDELYELKELLCKELEEYGKKGELSAGTLDIVDKLAHAAKNLGKLIEMYEEEGYSGAMNRRYSRYSRQGGGNRGGSGGGSSNGSYARGRGRNANRDSMGRYSSEGYSREGYSYAEDGIAEMIEEMRDMMQDLPQEKQMEVQKFIRKMEQM